LSLDRNFDELFKSFAGNIKSSGKGRLREALLREDLLATVPQLAAGGLKILDAGCGLGDMSLWLAGMGHHVTATDISAKMVDHTRALAAAAGQSDRLEVYQRPLQEDLGGPQKYDLICIHAVMEWLARPYDILPTLATSLAPTGHVSLSVYNLHRSVFNSLIKGNFKRILQGDFGGHNPTSMTPPNPIDPGRVEGLLREAGLTIELIAGLRCFYDHMPAHAQEEHSFEDLLLLERRYRKQLPYRDFARYIHFIACCPI
jgi:S-adenosylmethionine-dependent methyltransferase